MPPIAAIAGKMAFSRELSAPSISSRFTSRPINRKNIAIRPSLIQWLIDKPAT